MGKSIFAALLLIVGIGAANATSVFAPSEDAAANDVNPNDVRESTASVNNSTPETTLASETGDCCNLKGRASTAHLLDNTNVSAANQVSGASGQADR